MKVVNIFTPHPQDGTSFYRAWGVFNQIAKRENLPVVFSGSNIDQWSDVGRYQLVYMHRTHNDSHLRYIQTARRLSIPVWTDWDDDLINVPKYNPAAKIYENNVLADIISHSDVVSVTTKAMADNYTAPQANVIENFIPLEVKYLEPVKKDKFRIFWRGSNTHDTDFYVHKMNLYKFIKDKTDVEFICMGDIPVNVIYDLQKLCPVKKINAAEILLYLHFLQKENIADIVFVPLEDNPFNRAKSDCAVRECLLNGILSVTPEWNNSSVYAYTDNLQEQLENAYTLWKNNYNDFASKVVFQQRKAKEHAEKNYKKRVEILKNMLNL